MKKLFILFLFITLFIHTAFALNVRVDSMGRPLYAADRIKVKLSEDAAERLNLVLSEEGDYSKTGLDRLDNLFASISVSKIKLAHRPVLDKVWEQENGFNRWYLLFVPIGTEIENTITDISRNKYIEHVNPEYISYFSVTPNDSFFDECWGHDNTSSNGPGSGHTVGFDSHIEEAWDDTQGYGSASIIIAIIDSGVDYDHEDLDGNYVTGYDYGSGDSDPMDEYGHGTCCAGIAAGEVNNSDGISGVAGDCSIMPLKVSIGTGGPLSTAINNALTHCGDNNVDIASMSFGGSSDYGDDPARDAAILYAYNHGVTLLAATGNDEYATSINNPANDPNVIAVGAASPCAERKDLSSCDGQNWWASQWGVNTEGARNAVDVIAPTILPATDIQGSGGFNTNAGSAGDYYMTFNGTSCATPYAAGVAALIKSKDPSLTPAQIKGILTSTATDVMDEVITPGWDRYTGYGMVNADAAVGAVGPQTNTWTGDLNEYWGNNTNWSLGHIPTASEDVEIPNVNMPCIVDFSDKTCNNLLIYTGATVDIYDQELVVNGDLTISGQIGMLEDTATITAMGDVAWNSGSSLNVTAYNSFINVYGNWNFNSGANVNPTLGFVDFFGTSSSWIRSYSSNSNFYNLRIYKSGGAKAQVSNLCTEDLVVDNLTYITTGGILESLSDYDIIMKGYFNYYGTFDFTLSSNTGSVIFDGVSQNINNYSSGSGIFNNIVFNSSTGTTLLNNDMTVMGDLTINQGFFSPGTNSVTVGGNWTNTAGTFTPGTSLVTFDSSGDHQDVNGTNTFYNVNQVNTGNYLRFYGNTTINDLELNYFSWAYNTININGTLNIDNPTSKFTANGSSANATIANLDQGGTVYCNGEATITINDLVEYVITGAYYADDVGGVINLSNGGSAVDLAGDLYINGGTMNIAGNFCYWPYNADASITMTDGVLDVTSCGIYLSGSNTLTETITGGTIRTAYGFTGVRTDFNPTGGTIELYGSTDANLSMGAGSNFYDVLINKAVSDEIIKESKDENIISYNRDGSVVELTRAEIVNVTSDLDINGNLQIDSGTYNLNGNTVDVALDVHNHGVLTVDSILEIGNDFYLYSGSIVDLSGTIHLGTSTGWHGSAAHYTGSIFNQTAGDYYVESIVLQNGSQFNGTGGITHMYVNGYSASNTIEIDDPDSYFYYFSVDSGANAPLYSCDYDLYVSGTTNLYAPLDINGFTLSTLYMNVKNSGDLIINTNGVVDVRGNGPYMQSAGALTMTTGSELNSALHIQFQTGSIENVSGGDIYLGGSFTDQDEIFSPTGGEVIFVGSSTSYIYGPTTFYDLNISKTGAIVYTTNVMDINGDFIIDSGIFDTNGFDMFVAGDWMNNTDITGFVEGTQTVTFDGANYADILTSETFYNLIVNKTTSGYDGLELAGGSSLHVLNDLIISDGTLEMNDYSSLNVAHDVQIDLNAGLNAGGMDTGLNLYVGGNWTNDNIDYNTISGYTPGGETITFYGNTDQFLTTQAPQEDFGNLVIDKSGGEFRSNDNIRVIHDLDILTGGWYDNTSLLTHYFEGDFYITAGTTAYWNSTTGNTVVFKGLNDQTVFNPNGYHYFRNIVIDKTAWPIRSFSNHEGTESTLSRLENINLSDDVTETRALTVSLTSNIDLQWGNGLTVDEGTLDLNGMNLYSMGDVIINDGGTIIVDEGASLQVYGGDELAVNSGGTLEVLGTSGNLASITQRSTGNYEFNVFSGGTISAEYGLFEHMTDNGVYVRNGGFVDPLHSFDYCTFQNGYVGPGTLLYVENDQNLTITGANFPDDSSTFYNVAKITNHGSITLEGFTGIFSGETYEYDPNVPGLIHWSAGLTPIDDLTIQYNAGTNQIILNWTYPVPVDQYKVYRSTDPYDFSGADVFIVYTESYSETVTTTKYFYYVTAENITDNGGSREKTRSSDSAPWSK